MSVLAREPRVEINSWDTLKLVAKKVDLLGINKAKAKQVVQELYGIKLRGSQAISRIIIDFDIVTACLPADTLIYTNPRGPVPICDLKPGDMVYSVEYDLCKIPNRSYDPRWGVWYTRHYQKLVANCVKHEVMQVIPQGYKEVFELRTRTRRIRATDNHPFLVWNKKRKNTKKTHCYEYSLEWKPLRDIRVGDLIVIAKEMPNDGNITLDENIVYLAGLFVGDGWLRFRHIDGRYGPYGEVTFCIYKGQQVFPKAVSSIKQAFGIQPHVDGRGQIKIYSTEVAELFRHLDLDNPAEKKYVPAWVFNLPKRLKKRFIEGCIDSDGWRTRTGFGFKVCSKKLAFQLRELAMSIGLRVGNISEREGEAVISNRLVKSKTWGFCIYESNKRKKGRKYRYLPDTQDKFVSKHFALDRVMSILHIGTKEVYDIQVKEAHNFVANGILVHNSGGKEAMEEFFGEATEGEAYEHKLLEFYATNGVKAVYVTV